MENTQKKVQKSSLAKRNIQKFMNNKLAVLGFIVMMIFILAAIFAPLLTPYDASYVNPAERLLKPCAAHIFGTDNAGRDCFSRLLYGGRVSIVVGLLSALGTAVIGSILGCLAGYYGGKLDAGILYITEIFQTIPQTMLVLILVGIAGRSLKNLILVFCFTGWMTTTRLVRTRVVQLKNEPFVENYRANGVSDLSIMFRHILPNTLGPVIVSITLSTAGFVLSEASLSFLGMGVPNSVSTWGNTINAAKSLNIFQNYPNLWIAPGITISVFVLAVNFLGDGLRDVFDATE